MPAKPPDSADDQPTSEMPVRPSSAPALPAVKRPGAAAGRSVRGSDDDTVDASGASSASSVGASAPRRAPGDSSSHSASLGGGSTSAGTLDASPRQTMFVQDVERARSFFWIALAFAAFTAATLPSLGGDPDAKTVLAVALALCAATYVWLAIVLKDPAAYSTARVTFAAHLTIGAVFAGIWYFGVFSPAAVILPVGIYFFSLSQSVRATLSVYLACAIAYASLATLVVAGAVEDGGILHARYVALGDRLLMVALVEGTLVMTYLVARATRVATQRAIEQHDRAVRGIAKREALLEEARMDLERALAAGGVGRFTDHVIGSFRLATVLGRGGMGEVYQATHVETGEEAAVKMLHAHVLGDADSVRRFMREARIAASLQVPNVVRVIEVGGLDAALPYIAMELLRGETLADLLRSEPRLPVKKVVSLVRQVGRALDAARAAGVVHRDIKPRNIFLAEQRGKERVWKVLDFGVSKLLDVEATVNRDKIVGTPAYMAPEQALRSQVSHKTDLFALGVVCYRAITGRPAFSGDGMVEVIYQVVHRMPPPPTESVRVHPDVELVLAIALAKDPAKRFDTAGELADALEASFAGKLDESIRLRGQLLLARQPWGRDDLAPVEHDVGRGDRTALSRRSAR